MHKVIKSSALLLSVLVTGCASLGHDDYGCKGMPNGSTCMSTVEIYEATNSKNNLEVDYKDEREESGSWFSKGKESEESGKDNDTPDPEIMNRFRNQQRYIDSIVPDAKGTVPVLKSAEVLRYWVGDHETDEGHWNGESVHFVEITPRKWSTGEVHETNPEVFHPIQVVRPKQSTQP